MKLAPFKRKLSKFVRDDHQSLPNSQIRKLGLLYSVYRFVISVFLFLSSHALVLTGNSLSVELPSFLQQSVLLFYGLFSLLLLGFLFVLRSYEQRQLLIGLILDIVFISMLLYINGAPDIQLTMLYMVVVAASFILLVPYQSIIITMLAILFVIYQQFFMALTGSINLNELGQTILLSLSFLCVGFLSWTLTQRLVQVEKIAIKNAQEVDKLNAITQEIIKEMQQGLIVLDKHQHIIMSNASVKQLLNLDLQTKHAPYPDNNVDKKNNHEKITLTYHPLYGSHQDIELAIQQQHTGLIAWLKEIGIDRQSQFIYQVSAHRTISNQQHAIDKLRVTTTPMQGGITLVMLEDLRREQTNAQQLKLASLGQLTASIAHEIRNPLATISQASQLLMDEEDWENEDNDKINDDPNLELYKMIFSQTKRVNRIIEDVLNLSRQAKPAQEKLDIIEWLKVFIDNHFRHHDVFLHPQSNCEPDLFFDPHQLEQILINLINNGLRFSSRSHAHSFVEIDVFCQKNDVIIDVLDEGAGVSTEKIDNLFMPFFTTDHEGTGLGLYLSQAFAEANFARLLYIPEHEKTCFRIIIPKAISEHSLANQGSETAINQ